MPASQTVGNIQTTLDQRFIVSEKCMYIPTNTIHYNPLLVHVTFTCRQFSERRYIRTIYTLSHTFKVSKFVYW